jgi:SAM-dependent methyltransferase
VVSGPPIELPVGVELLASAPNSGGLDGRTLLAALLVRSTQPTAVLDVGCKSGWLLAYLARETGASTLVGVDRDGTHLPGPSKPVRTVVGDARRLPVAGERFDAITMFDVIEHLPKGTEPAALAEAARALCSGGLLFLSVPADWLPGTLLDPARWLIGHRHYPRVRILDLVGSAGLEPVLAETRGRWSDVLGLPLLYTSTRLGLPMPAGSWFRRWANREYGRPGRYTHFVVARKP